LLLGYNFRTSEDSDYSLVSNKNLSQKIYSSGWCSGPGNLGQNGLKPTPLMTSPTKKRNPKLSNFFNANYKTCRIFWGFEKLSSTIGWRIVKFQSVAKIAAQCVISKYEYFVHRKRKKFISSWEIRFWQKELSHLSVTYSDMCAKMWRCLRRNEWIFV